MFEHVDKDTRGRMNKNNYNVGPRHDPTIENSATICINDSQLYISNALNDLQQLKSDPLILFFANVDSDIYKLVASTNPTLKMAFDLAKNIMAEGV